MPNYRDVPDRYAECRAWGHSWQKTTVDKVTGEFIQGMKCVNCGTHRSVRISMRTGLREPGGYKYPEQLDKEAEPYQMPRGSGGALTSEERGQVTLHEIQSRYDEVAAARKRRRKKA